MSVVPVQPVLHRSANIDYLVQVWSQLVLPASVHNLLGQSAESIVCLGQINEHVVVSMFGMQHVCDLTEVVQVQVLGALLRTHYGDDPFCDVGQINWQRLLHD